MIIAFKAKSVVNFVAHDNDFDSPPTAMVSPPTAMVSRPTAMVSRPTAMVSRPTARIQNFKSAPSRKAGLMGTFATLQGSGASSAPGAPPPPPAMEEDASFAADSADSVDSFGEATAASDAEDFKGLPAKIRIPAAAQNLSFSQGLIDEKASPNVRLIVINPKILQTLDWVCLVLFMLIVYRERKQFAAYLRLA